MYTQTSDLHLSDRNNSDSQVVETEKKIDVKVFLGEFSIN